MLLQLCCKADEVLDRLHWTCCQSQGLEFAVEVQLLPESALRCRPALGNSSSQERAWVELIYTLSIIQGTNYDGLKGHLNV